MWVGQGGGGVKLQGVCVFTETTPVSPPRTCGRYPPLYSNTQRTRMHIHTNTQVVYVVSIILFPLISTFFSSSPLSSLLYGLQTTYHKYETYLPCAKSMALGFNLRVLSLSLHLHPIFSYHRPLTFQGPSHTHKHTPSPKASLSGKKNCSDGMQKQGDQRKTFPTERKIEKWQRKSVYTLNR